MSRHTDAIESLAKETGFISRKSSRLTGSEFLEMNLNDFGTTRGNMSLYEKCWIFYFCCGIM